MTLQATRSSGPGPPGRRWLVVVLVAAALGAAALALAALLEPERTPARSARAEGGPAEGVQGGPAEGAQGVPAEGVQGVPTEGAQGVPTEGAQEEPYAERRHEMVRRHIASVSRGARRIADPAVLEAMRTVPRHEFVRPGLRGAAYQNRPLPIGHGQTISQPYIVALMTELLEPEPDDRMLEVGTGSGYQAAVLAEIVDSVFTIEIIEPLATSARERLRRLGYGDVRVRHGDGYFGWPDGAPFDGIVVTAAAAHIPPPLVEQLAPGARMVIPVGPPFRVQQLMLVERRADGSVRQRAIAPVQFVPFTRSEP